jgi:hypothetical protein
MKRIILLFLILSAAFAAKTQPQMTVDRFTKWSITLDSNRRVASQAKNYAGCLKLIGQWVEKYNQLSQGMQQQLIAWKPGMYYNEACYYALNGQKDKALASFKIAVQSGYADYADTMTDSDLASLHDEPEFKAQLQIMREKGDYLYILKTSGAYSTRGDNLPRFTYQDASDPRLAAFKAKYKLDSVAGNGDEISRFKNLLAWAHDAVRHDGTSSNPAQRNGDSLITVCKTQKRGVNCRMMATILRDAYQAEGYKARIVTCLPKDTLDNDCHVIDIVWSNTLDKWIWMDPTFDAYLRDENGNYLNIEEVRARMISGATVILNEEANWNHQLKETKELYFAYMSKNLYWLECSTESKWDIETRKTNKDNITYINLYPGGYNTIHQAMSARGSFVYYGTNDPVYFWQKPQ